MSLAEQLINNVVEGVAQDMRDIKKILKSIDPDIQVAIDLPSGKIKVYDIENMDKVIKALESKDFKILKKVNKNTLRLDRKS